VNIRDEIARLSAEHDRLMCEHDQWMARREAAGAAPVQKPDEPTVLYREHHDNAPAPAPQPDAVPSDDDPSLEYALDKFSDAVTRRLEEDDRQIAELRAENFEIKGLLGDALARFAELRGRVDTLVELFGQKPTKLWKP
jgi:hypothetical protein